MSFQVVPIFGAKLIQNKRYSFNVIFIWQTSEGWPDLVIWLLNGGNRVGFAKISPADIIYSPIPEQSGKHCGKIQTIYLKVNKIIINILTFNTSMLLAGAKHALYF